MVKNFAHSSIFKDHNTNSRTFQGLVFSFANSRTFQDFQGPWQTWELQAKTSDYTTGEWIILDTLT